MPPTVRKPMKVTAQRGSVRRDQRVTSHKRPKLRLLAKQGGFDLDREIDFGQTIAESLNAVAKAHGRSLDDVYASLLGGCLASLIHQDKTDEEILKGLAVVLGKLRDPDLFNELVQTNETNEA